MPSSTSVPSSPLPFAADTHSHASWRQSHPRVINHYQSYASFLAAAHAKNAAAQGVNNGLRITTPSIAPSSVSSLPLAHRRLLRRHRRLVYWLLAGFYVSSILLTIAIVLIVKNTNLATNHGLRASGVIMGIIGFAGVAACLTGGWGVWKARKDRAKLEKKWVNEEKEKEKRQEREKARELKKTKAVKERERSLSVGRSVSRESAGRSVSRGRRREENDSTKKGTGTKRAELESYPTDRSRQRPKDKSKSASTKRAELEGYLVEEGQEGEILPGSFNLLPPNMALLQPAFTQESTLYPLRTTSLGRYMAAEKQKSTMDTRVSNPWPNRPDLDTDDESQKARPGPSSANKGKNRRSSSAGGLESSITKTKTKTSASSTKTRSEKSERRHKPATTNPPTTSSTLTPTSPFPIPHPLFHPTTTTTTPPHRQPRRPRSPPPPPSSRSPTPSDLNFLSMISIAADAASEDEEVREMRRTRSMERVKQWQGDEGGSSLNERTGGGSQDGRGGKRKGGKWRGRLGRVWGVGESF